MQILAIERYKDKKYENESDKYTQINNTQIQKYYKDGIISAYWSRGDKPGTVLMFEIKSVEAAKELIATFPLVQEKVITYSFLPLEPYMAKNFAPDIFVEEEKNFVLVYVSAEVGYEETKSILSQREKLQKRNNKIEITGVLLYENGSFLQILEGNEKKVNATYKRILNDTRHKNIVKLATLYTKERQFSDYSIGYLSIVTKDLQEINGFENYFENHNTFLDINDQQIKNLLNAFKNGKWRQK